MRRWTLPLLISSAVILAMGLAFYQELMWSWRFLNHRFQQPSYSSQAIPTCLGCNVLLVSLPDWDGKLKSDLADLFKDRTITFTRAYTNSTDPFKAEITLFHSFYPQHQTQDQGKAQSLFETLKERGYTILDTPQTVVSSMPITGHLTFLNSLEFSNFLKNGDLAKNTLVVLFAYTGNASERLHIPLVIFHPELKESREIHDLISLVDISPLLLNLLGAPAPALAEGRSLISPDPERPVYGIERDRDFTFDGEWKLVSNKDQSESLFYLPLDPRQSEDLIKLTTPWTMAAYKRLKGLTSKIESLRKAQ